MNSKYKDKLVGVYAPGNYGHTSVLAQTHIIRVKLQLNVWVCFSRAKVFQSSFVVSG